jgi:hypothetical protein
MASCYKIVLCFHHWNKNGDIVLVNRTVDLPRVPIRDEQVLWYLDGVPYSGSVGDVSWGEQEVLVHVVGLNEL